MSSFICSSYHYNTIEKTLEQYYGSSDYSFLERFFPHKGKIKEFITELKRLNVVCYYLQYRRHYDNIDVEIRRDAETMAADKSYKITGLIQVYHALQCTRYQIEIYHLEQLAPLQDSERWAMDTLDALISGIACGLVDNRPEFDTGTWEIRPPEPAAPIMRVIQPKKETVTITAVKHDNREAIKYLESKRSAKITVATLKAFVRKADQLFVIPIRDFDGMQDMVTDVQDQSPREVAKENAIGHRGAYIVGGGGDWIRIYEDETFIGLSVSNCCGKNHLVVKK